VFCRYLYGVGLSIVQRLVRRRMGIRNAYAPRIRTDLWLAQGDLNNARLEAESFLKISLATAELTCQALPWK
jgi:hypothetical protein